MLPDLLLTARHLRWTKATNLTKHCGNYQIFCFRLSVRKASVRWFRQHTIRRILWLYEFVCDEHCFWACLKCVVQPEGTEGEAATFWNGTTGDKAAARAVLLAGHRLESPHHLSHQTLVVARKAVVSYITVVAVVPMIQPHQAQQKALFWVQT